jgi:hypothetical protein
MDNASTPREILKGTDGGSLLRRRVSARTDALSSSSRLAVAGIAYEAAAAEAQCVGP